MNLKKWGTWLMVLLIATPLLVRRVELTELMEGDFLSLKTMIYFTGAYAAGMFIADSMEKRLAWIRQKKWLFIGIALISTAGLLYVTLHSIDRIGFFSVNSTLYYIQKIALSGLALVFFKSLGEKQPQWLNPIAKGAFTIYFAHPYFLSLAIMHLMPFIQYKKIAPFNVIGGGFLLLLITLFLSVLFAWLFRKLFGKYSRMIVGS